MLFNFKLFCCAEFHDWYIPSQSNGILHSNRRKEKSCWWRLCHSQVCFQLKILNINTSNTFVWLLTSLLFFHFYDAKYFGRMCKCVVLQHFLVKCFISFWSSNVNRATKRGAGRTNCPRAMAHGPNGLRAPNASRSEEPHKVDQH